ncbi:MAG: hypothetical protein LBI71_05510 [Enterobacteriaceae bacterium]|jgi:hypothetical protein|nr:hypothetical protein [Enterobacteriaceae bacterium]
MKKQNKIIQTMKEEFDKLGLLEKDPNVVGYVLFNTVNRRFVAEDKTNEYDVVNYVDDINNAYISMIRFTALLDIKNLPESDALNMVALPVIKNPLFGLVLRDPI